MSYVKQYKTIEEYATSEFVEKRSRFIGHVMPVTTVEEANEFIASIKSKYWDATHNCSAFTLKEGNISRSTDDGEPSGTAGMPILEVLTKNEVTNIACVVTRYYGGTLLGTGGLVRAYTKGAKDALEASEIAVMTLCCEFSLECTYNQYGKLQSFPPQFGGIITSTDFNANVNIEGLLPIDTLDAFSKEVTEYTRGSVDVTYNNEKFINFNKI